MLSSLRRTLHDSRRRFEEGFIAFPPRLRTVACVNAMCVSLRMFLWMRGESLVALCSFNVGKFVIGILLLCFSLYLKMPFQQPMKSSENCLHLWNYGTLSSSVIGTFIIFLQ